MAEYQPRQSGDGARLAVVVVTINNVQMLERLLQDLRGQLRMPQEVIVVDNASRDQTENMVKKTFPEVTYVKLEKNEGSAGGYYAGIRYAKDIHDYIYTLDDDVRLRANTISEIMEGFQELENHSHHKIGAVRSVGEKHPEPAPTQLAICPWRGTLFRTDVIRESGLPSRDYFLYGEDLEYSLRLAKKGYRFYWIPSSVCQERDRDRDGKVHVASFGIRSIHYQDPFRLYYAFRNETAIYLQYHYLFKLFRVFAYAAKLMLMISISGEWKGREASTAIGKGLLDGLSRRLGKNTNYSPSDYPLL